MLMSAQELGSLIDRHTDFNMQFSAPLIPAESFESFPERRASLARLYNFLVVHKPAERIMIRIGPFFHGIGRRPLAAKTKSPHGLSN
jgi:hypothetical protein